MIQHFYRLYSIKAYYKMMALIPCAIQYILVAYLFYTQQFVSLNPISLIAPTSLCSLHQRYSDLSCQQSNSRTCQILRFQPTKMSRKTSSVSCSLTMRFYFCTHAWICFRRASPPSVILPQRGHFCKAPCTCFSMSLQPSMHSFPDRHSTLVCLFLSGLLTSSGVCRQCSGIVSLCCEGCTGIPKATYSWASGPPSRVLPVLKLSFLSYTYYHLQQLVPWVICFVLYFLAFTVKSS